MSPRINASRPCGVHLCPEAAVRRGKCLEHARAADRKASQGRIRNTGTGTERGYDSKWARLSKREIKKQPWCSWCETTWDLTADHIVPLSRGGASSPDNVRVLCRSCNLKAAAQDKRRKP